MSAQRDVTEESFGFADEKLSDLLDLLNEDGVNTPELLEELAAFDPDQLMRRYRAVTIRKMHVAAQAQRERDRLNSWEVAKLLPLDRQCEFIGAQLQVAVRALAEKTNGKVKKLDTPHGYIQLRKQPSKLVVDDEEKAVLFLALKDERFVRVVQSVDKTEVKKAMLAGEVADVPGVTLEQPTEDKATIYPDVPKLKEAERADAANA